MNLQFHPIFVRKYIISPIVLLEKELHYNYELNMTVRSLPCKNRLKCLIFSGNFFPVVLFLFLWRIYYLKRKKKKEKYQAMKTFLSEYHIFSFSCAFRNISLLTSGIPKYFVLIFSVINVPLCKIWCESWT